MFWLKVATCTSQHCIHNQANNTERCTRCPMGFVILSTQGNPANFGISQFLLIPLSQCSHQVRKHSMSLLKASWVYCWKKEKILLCSSLIDRQADYRQWRCTGPANAELNQSDYACQASMTLKQSRPQQGWQMYLEYVATWSKRQAGLIYLRISGHKSTTQPQINSCGSHLHPFKRHARSLLFSVHCSVATGMDSQPSHLQQGILVQGK